MSDDRIDRIRRRAHAIWDREGRPDGRDAEHWSRAEAEIGTDRGGGETTAPPAACAVEAGPCPGQSTPDTRRPEGPPEGRDTPGQLSRQPSHPPSIARGAGIAA